MIDWGGRSINIYNLGWCSSYLEDQDMYCHGYIITCNMMHILHCNPFHLNLYSSRWIIQEINYSKKKVRICCEKGVRCSKMEHQWLKIKIKLEALWNLYKKKLNGVLKPELGTTNNNSLLQMWICTFNPLLSKATNNSCSFQYHGIISSSKLLEGFIKF